MKPHYTFSICLLATCVLTGCVQSPNNLQSNPKYPMACFSLFSEGKLVRPDAIAMPLEVVRYDRYLLVNTSPCKEFQQPPATKTATTMLQPKPHPAPSLVGH